MYEPHAGGFNVCREDVDCVSCFGTHYCPGDRVCVNLGQADGELADYRCVPACASDEDCAEETATVCSEGADGYGASVSGCFEKGPDFPVNYCQE